MDNFLWDRLERNEKLFKRIGNNPAPTVPVYDLTKIDGLLTSVIALLGINFSPSDQITCDLCNNNAGQPGTVIATAIPATVVVGIQTELVFSPAIALVTGTSYWVVLRRTGTLTSANFYQFHGSAFAISPPTINGAWYDGSIWNLQPTYNYSYFSAINYTGSHFVSGYDTGINGPFALSTAGYAQKIANQFTL